MKQYIMKSLICMYIIFNLLKMKDKVKFGETIITCFKIYYTAILVKIVLYWLRIYSLIFEIAQCWKPTQIRNWFLAKSQIKFSWEMIANGVGQMHFCMQIWTLIHVFTSCKNWFKINYRPKYNMQNDMTSRKK
jgi:hypothetical protein